MDQDDAIPNQEKSVAALEDRCNVPARSQDTLSVPVMTVRGLSRCSATDGSCDPALQPVDVELRRGELLAMYGPPKCGKSALLRILAGIDAPNSGTLLWNACDLATATEKTLRSYRREHVGMVFPFPNLLPALTLRQNLALGAESLHPPMSAEAALALVGLEHKLDEPAAGLTICEQQCAAIARAIVKRPSVLLCDEPSGALDAVGAARVLAILSTVCRALDVAGVLATSNDRVAASAHRCVTLCCTPPAQA